MNSRFNSNNLIGGLIALVLIAIGFALFFFRHQPVPVEEPTVTEIPAPAPEEAFIEITPATDQTLSRVAQIHSSHDAPILDSPEKTELELIRDSIDWSDAPSPKPELVKTDDYDVYINVTKEYLTYVFDKMGYTGDKIDSGETEAIPPLLVVSISKGWSDDETVQFKKSIFYRVILTLILYENEAVLRERDKLLAILETRDDDGAFPADQMERLNHLAYSYRVIKDETADTLTEAQIQDLLTRVDMVPPSLALAQAAHESGYATSRFAYTANALFGQWDWSADAIKPEQQREGMGNYGIKSFNQPIDSVRAYIWNLNTHRAYAGFRKERAAQRGGQQGRITLDSKKLADTLTSYSERGTEYTEELKSTISYNRLDKADHLRLIEGEPIYFN